MSSTYSKSQKNYIFFNAKYLYELISSGDQKTVKSYLMLPKIQQLKAPILEQALQECMSHVDNASSHQRSLKSANALLDLGARVGEEFLQRTTHILTINDSGLVTDKTIAMWKQWVQIAQKGGADLGQTWERNVYWHHWKEDRIKVKGSTKMLERHRLGLWDEIAMYETPPLLEEAQQLGLKSQRSSAHWAVGYENPMYQLLYEVQGGKVFEQLFDTFLDQMVDKGVKEFPSIFEWGELKETKSSSGTGVKSKNTFEVVKKTQGWLQAICGADELDDWKMARLFVESKRINPLIDQIRLLCEQKKVPVKTLSDKDIRWLKSVLECVAEDLEDENANRRQVITQRVQQFISPLIDCGLNLSKLVASTKIPSSLRAFIEKEQMDLSVKSAESKARKSMRL